jgi:predicted small lipoprotein YifL
MPLRSKISLLAALVLLFALSACGPQLELPDLDDLDADEPEPSGEQLQQLAGEGYADVYYHYHVNSPNLKFEIDMPFGISFVENEGSYAAQGIFQDLVTFTMAATGGETGTCEVNCTVNLKFVAEGSIELGDQGECQLPFQFFFVPQGDWLMDTTCPPEAHDVIDCNALSMVLMDATTYTFLASDTELSVPSGQGVKREAEIKNLRFPPGMAGACTWK